MAQKIKVIKVVPAEYTKVVYESKDGLSIATILPNWNITMKAGEEYYTEINSTQAGVTKWYCNATDTFVTHKYSGDYIIEAIPVEDPKLNKIILNKALYVLEDN